MNLMSPAPDAAPIQRRLEFEFLKMVVEVWVMALFLH